MFGALRERDFRLLFTGQTFSLIGSSITTVALAFAVLEISHNSPTSASSWPPVSCRWSPSC
jgi:hypothetical protein